MQHECVHLHEITEAAGTEEAEADADYDNVLKEAIRGVQDAVTAINEHLEEVRYEIAALEAEWVSLFCIDCSMISHLDAVQALQRCNS